MVERWRDARVLGEAWPLYTANTVTIPYYQTDERQNTPTENSAFWKRYSLGELNLVAIVNAILLTCFAKTIVA